MTAPSSRKLADALRAAGLEDLAVRAEADEWHDYLSPHALPAMAAAKELSLAGVKANLDNDRAKVLATANIRLRLINGEFDASPEEGDAWAASAEGVAAFDMMVRGGSARSEQPAEDDDDRDRPDREEQG